MSWQDDEVVLQCVACIQKENRKFCLAAEGLGNRLCYLEPTSEAKVRPSHSTAALNIERERQTHTHAHVCCGMPPFERLLDQAVCFL